MPLQVKQKVPAGALYGIGKPVNLNPHNHKPNPHECLPCFLDAGAPWTQSEYSHMFNRTFICGADSPCLKVTWEEGVKHYSVGPPYIVHVQDLRGLADKWADFIPRYIRNTPECKCRSTC